MKVSFLLFLSLSYIVSYSQTHNYDRSLNITWQKFLNSKYEYKISYPSSWKLKTDITGPSTSLSIEKNNETEAEVEILVTPNDNDSSQNYIEKLKDRILKNVKGLPNFKLIESKTKNKNTHSGIFINFSNTKTKNSRPTFHTIMWLINKGTITYRVMYVANDEAYAKYTQTSEDIFDSFNFISESQSFNTALLMGTWKGTITENVPDSPQMKTAPYTIIFEDHNDTTQKTKTTQLVYQFKTDRFDTIHSFLSATVYDDWLMIPYERPGPDGKTCFIKLVLNYTQKNAEHYLQGENKILEDLSYYSGSYCPVSISLKKISTDPTNEPLKTLQKIAAKNQRPATMNNSKVLRESADEKLSSVAAQLFKTVRKLGDSDTALKGTVVNLDISNKDKNQIATLSRLILSEDDALFIEKDNPNPFEANIEVYDFNDDGVYEVVLWKNNRLGPRMSSEFSIYYKPVITYGNGRYSPPYHAVLKQYGFPIVTKKKVYGFYTLIVGGLDGIMGPSYVWDQAAYRFGGNAPVSEKVVSPYLENLVGGSTPEELGKNLLRALKTNDFQLWKHCLHPTETQYRSYNEFRFKQCREKLEAAGVSNWNLISFSRVTYQKGEPPIVDGETIKKYFVIEFTYNNKQFVGALGQMTVMTYKQKTFFLLKQWEGVGMVKNGK